MKTNRAGKDSPLNKTLNNLVPASVMRFPLRLKLLG